MKSKILRWSLTALLLLATLIALFYAVENWRGAHAWAKVEAELKAKGEPLTVEEMLPPSIPDHENIAKSPFFFRELSRATTGSGYPAKSSSGCLASFQELLKQEKIKKWNQPNFSRGEGLLAFPAEEIQKFLSGQQREIQEMEEAMERPRARWDIEYEKLFEATIPHVRVCLDMAKLWQIKAFAELESGEGSKALKSSLQLFHLAEVSRQDAFLIGHLVGITIEQIALQVVWTGLDKKSWNPKQLEELREVMEKKNPWNSYERSMRWERVVALTMMDRIQDRDFRRNLLGMITSEGNSVADENILLTIFMELRPRGWNDQDKALYVHLLEAGLADLKEIEAGFLAKDVARMEQTVGEYKSRGILQSLKTPLTLITLPALGGVTHRTAWIDVGFEEACAATLIESYRIAHGKTPLSLQELAHKSSKKIPGDLMSGQPLMYIRKGEQDYLLYSLGWNKVDDGGYTSKKKELGDWVWPSRPGLVEVRDN